MLLILPTIIFSYISLLTIANIVIAILVRHIMLESTAPNITKAYAIINSLRYHAITLAAIILLVAHILFTIDGYTCSYVESSPVSYHALRHCFSLLSYAIISYCTP